MSVHLCLAFRDEDGHYTSHAAAVLVSLFRHTTAAVAVHVLHDDSLNRQRQDVLRCVAAHFDQQVLFHTVQPWCEPLRHFSIPLYGQGSLYRYFIPQCVEADTVCYVDCDVCFTRDVADLLAEAETHPLAPLCVVQDEAALFHPNVRAYVKSQGLNPDTYFNSGVLVLHLAALQATFKDFARTVIQLTAAYPQSRFPDQDALNRLFAKLPLHWMETSFNYAMPIQERMLLEPPALQEKILHFSVHKPWSEKVYPAMRLPRENYSLLAEILHS